MNSRILAIIPARSGSKGVKDKNIRVLCGKPLLAYTIEAAVSSKAFDTILVSTDSLQYAEIAKKYGAEVPFLREKETAEDDSSTWDVVEECLKKYEKNGKVFDVLVVLQPTSPLRDKDDICFAIEKMKDIKAGILASVCEVEHPIIWTSTISEEGQLVELAETIKDYQPRQKIEKRYRLNGAIYILHVEEFRSMMDKGLSPFSNGCYAYVMPQSKSIDIDSEIDFDIAECFIKKYCVCGNLG